MPSWFRDTGEGQTTLLGLVFLFVFMAYYMIQGFSANLYAGDLGSNMEATLYATFTVCCFLAPPITNKIGTRPSLFLGIGLLDAVRRHGLGILAS